MRPSYNDILIKVCASALMRHREVNAHFAEDAIELLPSADIGIAVAVPQGLIVPVVRARERKSIEQIAAESRELVTRTREGKLRQRTSRAARSRSRTSACTASSSSSPC